MPHVPCPRETGHETPSVSRPRAEARMIDDARESGLAAVIARRHHVPRYSRHLTARGWRGAPQPLA
jgi:hypothetical protein